MIYFIVKCHFMGCLNYLLPSLSSKMTRVKLLEVVFVTRNSKDTCYFSIVFDFRMLQIIFKFLVSLNLQNRNKKNLQKFIISTKLKNFSSLFIFHA